MLKAIYAVCICACVYTGVDVPIRTNTAPSLVNEREPFYNWVFLNRSEYVCVCMYECVMYEVYKQVYVQ